MKDHTSHDVLLLCPTCHQCSNVSDLRLRQKLADQCDAQFLLDKGGPLKNIERPDLKYIRTQCQLIIHLLNLFFLEN